MPEYKIKKGDTLSAIARKEGTTVSELMKLNPQIKDKNLIYAGAKLNLPYNVGKAEKNLSEANKAYQKATGELARAGMKETLAKAKAESASKKAESTSKGKSGSSGVGKGFVAGVGTTLAGVGIGKLASSIKKGMSKPKTLQKESKPSKTNLPKTAKAGKSYAGKEKMVGVDIQTMKAKTKKVMEPVKKSKVSKSAIAKAAKPVGKAIPGVRQVMGVAAASQVKPGKMSQRIGKSISSMFKKSTKSKKR